MATSEVKKNEATGAHKASQEAGIQSAKDQPSPGLTKTPALKGMSGGLLAFVICSFIIGGCNVITALYYTMKSLFLGWNDYTSILNAIVSIIMAVCFLMAAVEMMSERKDGKRLGEVALIAALVCSVITAVPGIIDGFPRQDQNIVDFRPSYSVDYSDEYYTATTMHGSSDKETLAAERALYVVTWAMIFIVRAGLVGLLIVYLEKSERVKNTLVK